MKVFSPRQQDILRLACKGLGHAEIGRELGISTGAVCVQIARAKKKAGARSATQAAAIYQALLFRETREIMYEEVD